MKQVFDISLLIFGTFSCGAAVWLVAQSVLPPWWMRQLILARFLNTPFHTSTHRQQDSGSVADFLDAIAREVHSGYSLTLAFVQTAERFPHHAWWTEPISVQCIRGHSLANSIADTKTNNWTSDIALAARTLSVASNGGYGVANTLEKSASILRERDHIEQERKAQTAQIRISTSMLSWIPLAICSWVIARQPHTRTLLLHSPLGLLCIVIGLLLNIAGRKWFGRIARDSS
jgi:Flp pilus assembly protein TadB